MNGNGVPEEITIVGQILIRMMSNGKVIAEAQAPGGAVMILGMIESAKIDLVEAMKQQAKQAAGVVAPSPAATMHFGR